MSTFTPEVEAAIEKRRKEMEEYHEKARLDRLVRINEIMKEFGFPEVEVTTEQLIEEHGGGRSTMPPGQPLASYVCKQCGKARFALRWNDDVLRKLAEREVCFTCNHWLELLEPQGHMARVVVDGRHYMYDNRMPYVEKPTGFMGHGGTVFNIKFLNSGDVIKTNNLWTQGEIPEHMLKYFPNNAVFIEA